MSKVKSKPNQSHSHANNLHESIKEMQNALAKSGCDPTWSLFEQTYNWYLLRKKMPMTEQDQYQEVWFQLYQKQKGALRKTCR